MNFLIENWYLFFMALFSGALLLWPTLSSGAAGGISAAQAVQLMNREKAVVIDVCEPQEYAAGHVAGAKNIPLAQLQERLPSTVKNKALPVIFVCARGMRAQGASAVAKKMGYEQAQTLAGGLGAWREAQLPVEKSELKN